jgi:pyruvate/2-oxoglutarate dehydrogenase complex dihydrolipoamide dehydrogenase (E3) component
MDGISANYSGAGFTGMKFKAIATSQEDFDAWVAKSRRHLNSLNKLNTRLAKPSQNNPVELYSGHAEPVPDHRRQVRRHETGQAAEAREERSGRKDWT